MDEVSRGELVVRLRRPRWLPVLLGLATAANLAVPLLLLSIHGPRLDPVLTFGGPSLLAAASLVVALLRWGKRAWLPSLHGALSAVLAVAAAAHLALAVAWMRPATFHVYGAAGALLLAAAFWASTAEARSWARTVVVRGRELVLGYESGERRLGLDEVAEVIDDGVRLRARLRSGGEILLGQGMDPATREVLRAAIVGGR